MLITNAEFIQGFIRLTDDAFKKGWHERNGGNLSYRIKPEEIEEIKSELKAPTNWIPIGVSVPNLANEYFLVSGTGRYMRNIILKPEDNICIAKIDNKGENYAIIWGLEKGGRPTSEFPTHLMNHSIKKDLTNGQNHVIYHAHPTNIIALTFVLPLNDKEFTRELWEMATEDPVIFPEGIGVVPWMVPGGSEIAKATSELMKKYNIVVWAHHGMFCSGKDFDEAFGLMDTAEKAAEICVKVRSMGGKKQTITTQNFLDLARDFKIISTGGELRAHSYALVGPIACETIKKYYVDTVLISCKALDMKKGLMESNEPESIIKRQMIEQAQKSILLADSTKFDKTAFTKTCDLAQIDTIATDKEPNIEWFDYIKENDIKLIY